MNPLPQAKETDLLAPAEPAFKEFLGTLCRIALGCLFIYMGLVKALHPVDFLKLVRHYDLIHSYFLLNLVASCLPWFEIFCGVLLCLGIAVRGASLIVLTMLLFFTLVILRRALMIQHLEHIALCAIRFDCGCGNGPMVICHKLAQNTGLILLAIFSASGLGRLFSMKHDLF